MAQMRDELESKVIARIDGVRINGSDKRLPNTSNFSIDGVDGESLLMNLDLKGFAVSSGAACSSGSPEPSPALMAMGLSRQEAQSSLRISLGWSSHPRQIERFVIALEAVVQRLRRLAHESTYDSVSDLTSDSNLEVTAPEVRI